MWSSRDGLGSYLDGGSGMDFGQREQQVTCESTRRGQRIVGSTDTNKRVATGE